MTFGYKRKIDWDLSLLDTCGVLLVRDPALLANQRGTGGHSLASDLVDRFHQSLELSDVQKL